MCLRFLAMVYEGVLEGGMCRDIGHAQQRLRQLILDARQLLQLGNVHVLEAVDLHHFALRLLPGCS